MVFDVIVKEAVVVRVLQKEDTKVQLKVQGFY